MKPAQTPSRAADTTNEVSTAKPTIKFHTITEILDLPDPEFLIDGLLVRGSFAVLYGPPRVGKSFLALSLAGAVATGNSWHGRYVKGGPVVYVAAEGFGGLKLRVAALLNHEGYDADAPCKFLDRPIDLMNLQEVIAFVTEIQNTIGKPALIIIDTLARCFVGGDENSAKDMGLLIHGVGTIIRETGATVLVIAHSGKDERRGVRGSSALMGAVDTMISCGGDLGILALKCEKQKDAEAFKDFSLMLKTVDLGDGRSSCVLVPFEAVLTTMSVEDNAKTKTMLAILEDKFGTEGPTSTEWQKACESEGISRETFFRRLKELKGSGLVEQDGDQQGARYRLAKSGPVSVSG